MEGVCLMSNAALNWAWSVQDLHPVEKLVLVALADHANPKTLQCNPGLESLKMRTCASRRGVQNAVAVLIERGLIQRDLRVGLGATYTLLTRAVSAPPTPATSARVTQAASAPPPMPNGADSHPPPVQSLPETRAVSAPEPLREPSKEVRTPLTGGSAPPLRVVATADPKGHRLPADWKPGGDLAEFAAKLGLNGREVAERFRDYWHAQPGAKGRKLDWAATWRNWCREDERRAKRPTAAPRKSRMDRWRDLVGEEDGPTIDGQAEPFRPYLIAATGD
jgi:hypothetical protein